MARRAGTCHPPCTEPPRLSLFPQLALLPRLALWLSIACQSSACYSERMAETFLVEGVRSPAAPRRAARASIDAGHPDRAVASHRDVFTTAHPRATRR